MQIKDIYKTKNSVLFSIYTGAGEINVMLTKIKDKNKIHIAISSFLGKIQYSVDIQEVKQIIAPINEICK